MTPWTQRAQEFNQVATIMALGTYVPLSDQIPTLARAVPADRFQHWSLFWTVAYTWVAFARINFDVPEGDRASVGRILLEGLARSHPSAQPLFDDLSTFIADRADVISHNATEADVVLKAILGLWLVWNLTGKASIPDERKVISQVGHLCYEPFAGYWLAYEHASSGGIPSAKGAASSERSGTLSTTFGARPTEIRCWSCKSPIEVNEQNRGTKVRCSKCGTKQSLPV